ncbi:hypothetical protein EHS25_008274 [Saitozyma podzolica]|uniref:Cation/H+ exchanger transmembrane domain-containing protein n=1 Tax=Saitozyma podzolica TaxID=1890683 RepID=A0A427YNY3_9TREE|nr:hypothetical protein EHS25_008274 [Saitozyma podzolica]
MVALDITETSLALAVAGGYISVVGLVSYFVKEKLFMSEALLATLAGIIFGPIAAGFFDPLAWVGGNEDSLNAITYQITRIVIGIQVLFTGIALPKAYLRREWLSLVTLLGPIMICAWFITSLLMWGLIPGLTFLECLIIGACVTPTDPVLANSICKGRFAEKHVPLHVRNIIVAESGANDGLGFPFLYIGLYLVLMHESSHPVHSVGGAIGEWFYNIVLYQICLSIVIGAIIGYVARKVLRFAEERSLIDHESFLSFGIALTFFTLGIVGVLGSDDILCCFIVGNSFTWDDWFRVQTEDHAFQDVIDQLLSSAIFLYIGAVMPWNHFGDWYGITPWRLVVLGILVMLVRRLPWVMVLSRWIPTLPTWREAVFAGFFGPIGVGAVFYTQVALQVLPDDGTRTALRDVILPVNYFLVLTSIIVHGITIPIGKGFQQARSITLTRSQAGLTEADRVSRLPAPLPLGSDALRDQTERELERSRSETTVDSGENGTSAAIRFDLDPNRMVDKGPMVARPTGILAQNETPPRTPKSSHPGTPSRSSLSGGGDLPPPVQMGPLRPAVGASDDRETSEQRARGESWLEGERVVVESDDGETVRVMTRDEYDRFTSHR